MRGGAARSGVPLDCMQPRVLVLNSQLNNLHTAVPAPKPQDLFQRSPAAAGPSGLKVTLTPKSTAPASAAKSVPRTAGRSRLAQAGTPAASQGGLPATQEVEQGGAAAASSARKPAASAGRRRSLSRTPGTKIVIIEQGTQTTHGASARAASAAKRPAASQVRVRAVGGHRKAASWRVLAGRARPPVTCAASCRPA